MNPAPRAVSTLVGAGIAGVLLWLAGNVGRGDNGGYWAASGIVAAAGLVFALSQLRGRNGNPLLLFLLVFLPVLVVAGWVLVSAQPHGNWFSSHVLAWSGDLGLRQVVEHVGAWLGVLAFGIGYALGLALEPPRRAAVIAPVAAPVAHDRVAADEPVTAERHEVEQEHEVVEPAAEEPVETAH
jgi:hypothetical protein